MKKNPSNTYSYQCAVGTLKEREKIRHPNVCVRRTYTLRIRYITHSLLYQDITIIHNCIYFYLGIWINRFLFFALSKRRKTLPRAH